MGNHLVVSFCWQERDTPAREYLRAAEQVIERMADIDAEPIAWSSKQFAFTCSPSSLAVTLSATLNLLREGLRFGVGVSQRDLEMGELGHLFGPGLIVAEALAAATRAGEVLLDPMIDAVADEQLPTVGSLLVEVDGQNLRAALMVGSTPFDNTYSDAPDLAHHPISTEDHTLVDMQSWAPAHEVSLTLPASPPEPSAPEYEVPLMEPSPAIRPVQDTLAGVPAGGSEVASGVTDLPPSSDLELQLDDLAWAPARAHAAHQPPDTIQPQPVISTHSPPVASESARPRRLSQPPPKPASVRGKERLSTPPPKPNAISGETRLVAHRESRIEALRDGELGEVLHLVDQLWDEQRRQAFVNHLDQLTQPTGNPMEESLQELHSALHETQHADADERGRLALAYAVCLAKAGKPAEALLESLQALATARRHGSPNGERASELLLAQLARYTGQPQLAERWLKIPKAL